MANKIPLAIADFETSLSVAISAGATSLTLSSATDDDGNALPAGKYCFTVNNGSSNKQYLLGQLNGTAVTSVVNVSRQGVETSGAAFAARAGSPIIISDFATIQRVADILRGQIDLDGSSPIGYDAEPTLADRKDLATVGYVLDTASGGTVNFDSMTVTGNAGEAIVAGNLVYFNTVDQEWYKTDADVSATVTNVQFGISLGSGSDGVGISGGIQISGTYTTSGLTPGSQYYVSNTAGGISDTAGTISQAIGVAMSATKLLLYDNNPNKLTTTQKEFISDLTTNGVIFGGDGSDGVLNVTSGTTTLSLASKNIWQYSSITIASGATLQFSDGTDGSKVPVLKCQGNFLNEGTITTVGAGVAGGTGGAACTSSQGCTATSGTDGTVVAYRFVDTTLPDKGKGGTGGDGQETGPSGGAVGVGGAAANKNATYFAIYPLNGSGGGGGGGGAKANVGTPGAGGNGGAGSLGLLIEIIGNFSNLGTITLNGVAGSNGGNAAGNGSNSWASGGGGGGGGGGAGSLVIKYKGSYTNSGTLSVDGGAAGAGGTKTNTGGSGGSPIYGAGGGGGSGGATAFNSTTAGTNGGQEAGGAGSAGGAGIIYIENVK